jgi:hypothetical protein
MSPEAPSTGIGFVFQSPKSAHGALPRYDLGLKRAKNRMLAALVDSENKNLIIIMTVCRQELAK